MKLNLDIIVPSPKEWIDAVMADFNTFLRDHADNERKASAMATSLIAKYPNRVEIIPELLDTAVEEMEHFRDVYSVMAKRGIQLTHSMGQDLYVKQLINLCHSGREERFRDRLLVASVVETRGAERFKLVAEALEDVELKDFYKRLWTSEAKHGHIFVKFALEYFPEEEVYKRLTWFIEKEGEIILNLPIRPTLH